MKRAAGKAYRRRPLVLLAHAAARAFFRRCPRKPVTRSGAARWTPALLRWSRKRVEPRAGTSKRVAPAAGSWNSHFHLHFNIAWTCGLARLRDPASATTASDGLLSRTAVRFFSLSPQWRVQSYGRWASALPDRRQRGVGSAPNAGGKQTGRRPCASLLAMMWQTSYARRVARRLDTQSGERARWLQGRVQSCGPWTLALPDRREMEVGSVPNGGGERTRRPPCTSLLGGTWQTSSVGRVARAARWTHTLPGAPARTQPDGRRGERIRSHAAVSPPIARIVAPQSSLPLRASTPERTSGTHPASVRFVAKRTLRVERAPLAWLASRSIAPGRITPTIDADLSTRALGRSTVRSLPISRASAARSVQRNLSLSLSGVFERAPEPMPMRGPSRRFRRAQRGESPATHAPPQISALALGRPVELVWRANKNASPSASNAMHGMATGASPSFATRSPSPDPPAQASRAANKSVVCATALDPALADRVADDVIRRIDRRARIERERRGL